MLAVASSKCLKSEKIIHKHFARNGLSFEIIYFGKVMFVDMKSIRHNSTQVYSLQSYHISLFERDETQLLQTLAGYKYELSWEIMQRVIL